MKRRMKIKKSRGLKTAKRSKVMDLVIGAILANVGSKFLSGIVADKIPYSKIAIPSVIAITANMVKIPYNEGMVVGGSVTAITEALKQFLPENISKLLNGEDEYVIAGAESADPLLGAQFLLGEMQARAEQERSIMNPLDRDEYVVSGSTNDPLD